MKLPNLLTIFRIILIPFFIACYYIGMPGWNFYAAGIFIVASITDFLDGAIARKTNSVSNFGKLMDPIADKLLVMAALLILLDWGKIGVLVVAILLAREFIISGIRMVAASSGAVIAAGWIGKAKTVAQLVGISLVLLQVYPKILVPAGEILLYISVVLSIWSCVDYMVKNRMFLKG